MKKSKSVISKTKPWITSAIQKSIRNKNSLYKSFMKAKSRDTKKRKEIKFKKYRNLLSLLLRQSKKNYFKDYFSNQTNNLRNLWKGIKDIIGSSSKTNEPPVVLVDKHNSLHSNYQKANHFNEFFGSIAEHTKNQIRPSDSDFRSYLKLNKDLGNANSIFLNPTNSDEISALINKLGDKKATGSNSINSKILKMINSLASLVLSLLHSRSVPELPKRCHNYTYL